MRGKRYKTYEEKKRAFIKSVFSTTGVIFLLTGICLVTNPPVFWAKFPITVMLGVLFLKGMKLMGEKVANGDEFEAKNEEVLELRKIDYQDVRSEKTWRDSDLV